MGQPHAPGNAQQAAQRQGDPHPPVDMAVHGVGPQRHRRARRGQGQREALGDDLGEAEHRSQHRCRQHPATDPEKPAERARAKAQHAHPGQTVARRRAALRRAPEQAPEHVAGQRQEEDHERFAHPRRIDPRGHAGRQERAKQAGQGKDSGLARIDAVALVVAPQRQHHVRYHHHQRGTLRQLLVETEDHPQRRDRQQAAAYPEQTAQATEHHPQQEIEKYIQHVSPSFDASMLGKRGWMGNAQESTMAMPITQRHEHVARYPQRTVRSLPRCPRWRQLLRRCAQAPAHPVRRGAPDGRPGTRRR